MTRAGHGEVHAKVWAGVPAACGTARLPRCTHCAGHQPGWLHDGENDGDDDDDDDDDDDGSIENRNMQY